MKRGRGRPKSMAVLERELIQRLALITGYTDTIVRDVIKAQTEFVLDELRNNTPVRIGNILTIETKRNRVRAGYNFATKQNNPGLKDVYSLKIKPTAALKKVIKSIEI